MARRLLSSLEVLQNFSIRNPEQTSFSKKKGLVGSRNEEKYQETHRVRGAVELGAATNSLEQAAVLQTLVGTSLSSCPTLLASFPTIAVIPGVWPLVCEQEGREELGQAFTVGASTPGRAWVPWPHSCCQKKDHAKPGATPAQSRPAMYAIPAIPEIPNRTRQCRHLW